MTIQISYVLSFLQDEGLDVISEGLDALKNLARDMNEVCCFLMRHVTEIFFIQWGLTFSVSGT